MTRGRGRRRIVHRVSVLGWLWLLWVVLWGDPTPLVVLGGLTAALAVAFAFPLPPVTPHAAPHPVHLVRLLGRLIVDVVGSGATVAAEALRPAARPRTAVVEVPVRVDTDLLITATANLTTLAPGTLVLEIDRAGRLLYIHALPVRDTAAVEERRHEAQRVEHRVAGAIGPAPARKRREPRQNDEQEPGREQKQEEDGV